MLSDLSEILDIPRKVEASFNEIERNASFTLLKVVHLQDFANMNFQRLRANFEWLHVKNVVEKVIDTMNY